MDEMFFFSTDIIRDRVIRTGLVGHVEQMEEVRYAYKTLIGNMKWKKGF
jgi:hypothetical protein